jgi:LAO/AO transport system kinase
MDAMGKEVVLVETVGVGQDEVEIIKLAHTNVVVLIPGMGDEIQAIKAGILEVGDIFVVNKADRSGADKTVKEIEGMLEMNAYERDAWRPPVVKTEAPRHVGVPELMEQIDRHRAYLGNALWEERQRERVKGRFMEILRDSLLQQTLDRLQLENRLGDLFGALDERRIDPYSASEQVMKRIFSPRKT